MPETISMIYDHGLYRGYIEFILGLEWDNGKENGNDYTGLYREGPFQ